jgi:CRP/FNR family cyclic AMP-dependent transcriptional regulator
MEFERPKARAGIASPESEAQRKHEILQASPFAGVEGTSRTALLELGLLEQYPRRHRVVSQGEPVRAFVLLGSGRVKLERSRGDRTFPLGHRGPGQMVGEPAVAGAPAATESVTVIDEAEVLAFPLAGLRKQLSGDAPLRAAMAAAMVAQHRAAETRLESLLLHGVEERLCAFLADAVARWGRPHPGGEVITAPFTHADIALLIGSTRETVTLLLGKLKRSGALAFDKRRVVIPDRAALAPRAEAPATAS